MKKVINIIALVILLLTSVTVSAHHIGSHIHHRNVCHCVCHTGKKHARVRIITDGKHRKRHHRRAVGRSGNNVSLTLKGTVR